GQLQLLHVTPFQGVAAGDATSTDAILWTRAVDRFTPASMHLTAQVTTDSSFNSGILSFGGNTDSTHDYTLKVDATGLQSGTRYYYRFMTDDGVTSQVGAFVTAPGTSTSAPLHFGFTGDADGLLRPYDAAGDAVSAGVPTFANQGFDNFV